MAGNGAEVEVAASPPVASVSNSSLAPAHSAGIEWYEQRIELRGCELSLFDIKSAYINLHKVNLREGERVISLLQKPSDVSVDDFRRQNDILLDSAFRLTVSVVGFNGTTAYGEDASVFDSPNLPKPIRTIFFTNENAFRRNANDSLPANRFSVWLNFDKPPLMDANSIVSSPTFNESNISIHANEVSFHRAVRDIVNSFILSKRKWYSFIHKQFAYDVGLWFLALPYILIMLSIGIDKYIPASGPYSSFRVAAYLYFGGLALVAYRGLFGYLKWAFPVNSLIENNDLALRHRMFFWGIILALITTIIRSLPSYLWPW